MLNGVTEEQHHAIIDIKRNLKLPEFHKVSEETSAKQREMKKQVAEINQAAKEATAELTKTIDALIAQRKEYQKAYTEQANEIEKRIESLWIKHHWRSNYPARFDTLVAEAKIDAMQQIRQALGIDEVRFNRIWNFAEEHTTYDTDRWDDPIEHSHFYNTIDFILEMISTMIDIEAIEERDSE
jgi:hypothetical protein